jgi:hypothetical protein
MMVRKSLFIPPCCGASQLFLQFLQLLLNPGQIIM